MDTTDQLTKFIVNTRFEDISQEALDVAKKEVIDAVATSLCGSRDEAASELYEFVKSLGGREESTIIAHRGKFPAQNAALVNSTMCNSFDYDDTHERGHIHAGSVVIPSALAVSEVRGNVDGKEFLTAICVAVELGCRIGMAVKPAKPIFMGGWAYEVLHSYFTGAAVAGKILQLNEYQMRNALGIAYQQASGNTQAVRDRADTKKIGCGFAARGGILSALLAQRGLTGAEKVFDEGDASFYNMYHAGCDRTSLLKDLGQKFEMFDMSFKPYPCCRLNHRYIDAIIRFAKGNTIKADDVEVMTPIVCKYEYQSLCVPEEVKKEPESTIAAQFSLPWTMACALVRKKVGISEFTKESLNAPALLEIAAKINPVLDPSLPDEMAPTVVKVKTKRESFEVNTDYAYGSIQNPMSFEDIERKLIDCASMSVKNTSQKVLMNVIHMLRDLEKVKNIEEIVRIIGDNDGDVS